MIPPDRNVQTAALLLGAIAGKVEQARRHLSAEIRLCDGLPSSTSGADNNGSRGERTIAVELRNSKGDIIKDANGKPVVDHVPVTIVEAAAIQRQHLHDTRDDLNAMCRGLVTMANELAKTCDKILGTRIETKRCTATGRDGAIEWGDPTCVDVPSRGPLCDRCAQREYRWRKLHALPPRTDGLFSGDAA